MPALRLPAEGLTSCASPGTAAPASAPATPVDGVLEGLLLVPPARRPLSRLATSVLAPLTFSCTFASALDLCTQRAEGASVRLGMGARHGSATRCAATVLVSLTDGKGSLGLGSPRVVSREGMNQHRQGTDQGCVAPSLPQMFW